MRTSARQVRVTIIPKRTRASSMLGDVDGGGLSQDVRNKLGQAADTLETAVNQLATQIKTAIGGGGFSWATAAAAPLLGPFALLLPLLHADLFSNVHTEQLDNQLQLTHDIATTMQQMATTGRNADGVALTPTDIQRVFQAAADNLRNAQQLLNNVNSEKVGALLEEVVRGVIHDLAQILADIGDLLQTPLHIAENAAKILPWVLGFLGLLGLGTVVYIVVKDDGTQTRRLRKVAGALI